MIRIFRLTNEPGGLGLSCTPDGVSLAGVPLLRKTQAGFVPRASSEITVLIRAAYGQDPTEIQSRLGVIAQALNRADFADAMIAAVHTRTAELSPEAAKRLVRADEELTKYNYNPDEPRDWHGRWTSDGSAGPISNATAEVGSDQRAEPFVLDHRPRVAENVSPSAATSLSDAEVDDDAGKAEDDNDSREPASLEQTFERKYDYLSPVDFAKEVIQFGDRLGRSGGNLSPAEMAYAVAEYSFLQHRLSFWLAYGYKPPMAQENLLSAALALYQGAVNGGIAGPGHLPQSMLYVAGAAAVFTDGPPRRPSTEPDFEEPSAARAQAPKEMEGLGGSAARSEVEIEWNGDLKARKKFEDYIKKQDPDMDKLEDGSTTFDLMNWSSAEATSAKTLNTLTVYYIKTPLEIYRKIERYVDAAVNYQPRRMSDVDPAAIMSKTLQLAIPEWTSPTQWRYLNRAIIYGKDNGVSVVITRIRE